MSPRRTKWELLRHRAIWILVILLVPPFILFFSGAGPAPRSAGAAGSIFGRPIPRDVFEQQQAWVRAKLPEERSRDLPSQLRTILVQQEAWRELLLLAEATRRRMRIDDRELATFIHQIPAFQEGGRFRPEYYHHYLGIQRISPPLFEELLRNDLVIERLVKTVKGAVSVSDEEVKAAYREGYERLQASLLFFDPARDTASAAAALTEQDLRGYYEAHREELRISEQVRFEYVGASRDELLARAPPISEDELKAYSEEHEAQFRTDAGAAKPLDEAQGDIRRQAADAKARKQLTALTLDLREDMESRLRFEEIALIRSLTPHAVGPLSVERDQAPPGLDPDVLSAVARLKTEGGMTDVVETDRGVYLARVTQRIPSRVPTWEESRATVRSRLIEARAREAARQAADALRKKLTDARAAGTRFEEAFLAAGAKPAQPVSFTRNSPIDPIGESPAVNQAAFALPLGEFTDVLETPKGFVIVRPETRIPADETAFATVEAAVRQETLTNKQAAHFDQWLHELEGRAQIKKLAEPSPSP